MTQPWLPHVTETPKAKRPHKDELVDDFENQTHMHRRHPHQFPQGRAFPIGIHLQRCLCVSEQSVKKEYLVSFVTLQLGKSAVPNRTNQQTKARRSHNPTRSHRERKLTKYSLSAAQQAQLMASRSLRLHQLLISSMLTVKVLRP